uniref:Bestrophin homolog n=1 Tax=Wuchereria bancrofti TaxID=6293 RepID=A0AAF5RV83_WUCBA
MTINYNLQLSNSKPWALFLILLRWRGSIWKLVLIELVIFLLMFLSINIFLNHILPENTRKTVAEITQWFKSQETFKMIPMEFMLGFLVQAIITRWQKMIHDIGFIDSLSLTVASYIHGNTDYSRMIRRNIVRYVCLAQVLASRDFSIAVRKRFPTIDSIKEKFDQIDCNFGSRNWLPVQWALSIVHTSRREQLIDSDFYCERICEEIRCFRNSLANLCKFDWVPLPLAYPQLVYLAVHVHFFIILISKQEIILPVVQNNMTESPSAATTLHRWIPLTPAIQFFFYMAWTKVAMVLINPFGEDDDDFETNALIDRNFKVGIRIADGTSDDVPRQLKDSFWNHNIEALYSEKSIRINERQDGLVGSATRFPEPYDVEQILMVPLKRNSINNISNGSHSMYVRQRSQRQNYLDNGITDIGRQLRSTAKSITSTGTSEEHSTHKNSWSLRRDKNSSTFTSLNEKFCYVNKRYMMDEQAKNDSSKQHDGTAGKLNLPKSEISQYEQHEKDTSNQSVEDESKDDDSFEQIAKM